MQKVVSTNSDRDLVYGFKRFIQRFIAIASSYIKTESKNLNMPSVFFLKKNNPVDTYVL